MMIFDVFSLLLLLLLMWAARPSAAQSSCADGCLMGECLPSKTCPPVPVGTCIKILIDNKVPFSDSLPLNQRSAPSTTASVPGTWKAGDRPKVVAQFVFAEFRSWFKLQLNANAPVWSAYGRTRGASWFEPCTPPKTAPPPTTSPPTAPPATPAPAVVVVTSTTTAATTPVVVAPTSAAPLPSGPAPQCQSLFGCRECVDAGCEFCFNAATFTVEVPGVCAANCTALAQRTPQDASSVVPLDETSHCESLENFVQSKIDERTAAAPGESPSSTRVHYCQLPGTTCLRCLSRIGCSWCETGYCVFEAAMCDVPNLFTAETQCSDFAAPTEPPKFTGNTATALVPGLNELELGLAIGGGLFAFFVIAAIVTICLLVKRDKAKSFRSPRFDEVVMGQSTTADFGSLATNTSTYGQGRSYAFNENY